MLKFDRRLLLNFDWIMLFLVLIIAAMGLANLYSAVYQAPQSGIPLYLKQLYFFLFGFAMIFFIICFDYHLLLSWNYKIYALTIILLLVALLFGKTAANAQRWINLGFFNLQPSELAKLSLVITLASYYYRKDTGKGFTLKELIPPILLTLLPFLLILKQPDLGTAMMLGFIFVSMTLFVKLQWSALTILSAACCCIIPAAWRYVLKPYQKKRVFTFLNPESDPLGSGYHIMQSKIAVGSGGKIGKGFLHGTQGQLDFLPERHTDFAFSVWAEEWGFIGSVFFMICYFSLILWCLSITITSRDKFGVLLAQGIVSLMFWQAFINIAMVLGLLPVVGMPLPLFSYGGSSLITTLAGFGILMSIRMRRHLTKP